MSFESFVNWLNGFLQNRKKLNCIDVCIILEQVDLLRVEFVSLRIFEAILRDFIKQNRGKWFYDKKLIYNLCWWFQFEHRGVGTNKLKTELEYKLEGFQFEDRQ